MPKTVLLTRPQADNTTLAKQLAALDIATVESPLLTIIPQTASPLQNTPDALLVTSRHAVHACSAYPDIPLYAVGEQTAALAAASGCRVIAAHAPDAAGLVAHLPQGHCRIAYLSGDFIRFDFAAALPLAEIERVITYKSIAATSLTPAAQAALNAGHVDSAVLYSPRSAEIFAALLPEKFRNRLSVYCLSPAIAETCAATGGWKAIKTSTEPTQAAMIELLAKHK